MDTDPPLQPRPTGELSILVVDDDALVREVTVAILADAGHVVHEAADGLSALAHLDQAGPPDLLITDINMPRMDGLELAGEVRGRWPSLPVLLVTGRPQPPGRFPCMTKPFGWSALLAAVGRVVQGAPRTV